jgi:hypothetical protein
MPDEAEPDAHESVQFAEDISDIDVDQLTPRQALDLLYELRDRAKSITEN